MSRRTLAHWIGKVSLVISGCLISERADAFSSADPARILYVGDSIALETLNTVRWWTQVTGKATTSDSVYPGTAICDFLEGKPAAFMPVEKQLKPLVRTIKPHLVVLQFWGNNLFPCMNGLAAGTDEYYNQYFWDALNAVQQIEAAANEVGIARPRILWVLQGPDRDNRVRTQRLNDIYAFMAANRGDRTSDAGFDVSAAANPYPNASHDRYEWTLFSPCTAFERQYGYCTNPEAFGGVTRLHRDGDPIHFCLDTSWGCNVLSPGVNRYGMHIAHDANAWLGIG